MKQITATEFKLAVARDPKWVAKLTEPVEITGYCNMEGSHISELGPLLTFKGRNNEGWVACFTACSDLKVAEGVFHGFVSFSESGIERIGELRIIRSTPNKSAASFYGCKNLKLATGSFPGFVDFAESGIDGIESLVVSESRIDGSAASFENCQHLRIAGGEYAGWVDFSDSGIVEIGDLHFTNEENCGADVIGCANLKVNTLPRNQDNWKLDQRQRLDLEVDAIVKQALNEPSIEI